MCASAGLGQGVRDEVGPLGCQGPSIPADFPGIFCFLKEAAKPKGTGVDFSLILASFFEARMDRCSCEAWAAH